MMRHYLFHPEDRSQHLHDFNPQRETWVVADLRSKLEIKRELLQHSDFVEDESILRVSELWTRLLFRQLPEYRMVSNDFAKVLIHSSLAKMNVGHRNLSQLTEIVFLYMSQLIPVLSHPEGEKMMQDWFQNHRAARVRWGLWYQWSQEVWREFQSEKWMTAQWAAGVLLHQTDFERVWNRSLIFDLGIEMNPVEAEMVQLFNRYLDVKVLMPLPQDFEGYKSALSAYEQLDFKISREGTQKESINDPVSEIQFEKFTTMMAEGKNAVSKIRKWLDGGCAPSEITLIAPDIEVYWPILSEFFACEGIPVDKEVTSRLHSLVSVSSWVSRLRWFLGKFENSYIEEGLFGEEISPIPYEKFKKFYTAIYDEKDLGREIDILTVYKKSRTLSKRPYRDEFINWSIQFYSGPDESMIPIFQMLMQECPPHHSFEPLLWLSYLEALIQKKEITVEEKTIGGIQCLSLNSAGYLKSQKILCMGLAESFLRTQNQTQITFEDVFFLEQLFGFQLLQVENMNLEFEAHWVFNAQEREIIATFPASDFDGKVLAPSSLWLKGAKETGVENKMSVPQPIEWDRQQQVFYQQFHDDKLENPLLKSLREERLKSEKAPCPPQSKLTLSATSLEDYYRCPFIFAAKKMFLLSDLPHLDIDVDRLTQGSLHHLLLEKLLENPICYSGVDLDRLLETIRSENRLVFADESVWEVQKKKSMDLAQRFLKKEKEWRAQYPKTKTVGREETVQGFIESQTGELTQEEQPNSYPFYGKIDRIDCDDEGRSVVIDYKSSRGSLKQHQKWVEEGEWQLLLYTMAVESGLTSLNKTTVDSAVYYIIKDMERDIGFKLIEHEGTLFSCDDAKRNKIKIEDREVLINQLKGKVVDVIQRIDQGEMTPSPRDLKTCSRCEWKNVCRAHHLMI